jgi:uncharacterized protein (TIGR03435 family)
MFHRGLFYVRQSCFVFGGILLSRLVCAQAEVQPPSFEVASIKLHHYLPNRSHDGATFRGGPGTNDPSQITGTNLELKYLIMTAYDLNSYRFACPDWMSVDHYDITAKVPPGATKELSRVMLQNLLVERFKLRLRHESREVSAYALTVGKNGLKLKPSGSPSQGTGPAPMGSATSSMVKKPPAWWQDLYGNTAVKPGSSMSMGRDKVTITGVRQSLDQFVTMLSDRFDGLDRPVVNETGVTGEFDYALTFSTEGMVGFGSRSNASAADASEVNTYPNIFDAIQIQMGLKLEPRKRPVDVLVVEAERTAIEN